MTARNINVQRLTFTSKGTFADVNTDKKDNERFAISPWACPSPFCHPACPACPGLPWGMPWDRTLGFLLRGATNDHVCGPGLPGPHEVR